MAFRRRKTKMTTPMSPTMVNTPATAALFEKKLEKEVRQFEKKKVRRVSTYPLVAAFLTAAAEAVLVVLSDTTVVETSVMTAGNALVVGVKMF